MFLGAPGAPRVIITPPGPFNYRKGDRIEVLCSADDPNSDVTWYRGSSTGKDLYQLFGPERGSLKLILDDAQPENSAPYVCVVEDVDGKVGKFSINVKGKILGEPSYKCISVKQFSRQLASRKKKAIV